jgi:hypothetical protein
MIKINTHIFTLVDHLSAKILMFGPIKYTLRSQIEKIFLEPNLWDLWGCPGGPNSKTFVQSLSLVGNYSALKAR